MFERFATIGDQLQQLENRLSDPAVLSDQKTYQRLAQEHSHLSRLHSLYTTYQKITAELTANRELLSSESDEELLDMAKDEIRLLEKREKELQQQLRILLLPKDPNDEKNIFLEIRAGTGGDEAALFVADLFKMYSRFAESQGWKVEVMSSNPIGIGGFKEIIAMVSGNQVYSTLKFESGVHRVQRVPATETQGRIHTSAVTVAVIPEADEVDVSISPSELKFDVFRSSGPGGQSVNTTDSAVRVTHLPTGLVVICQDEKSQHKNKAKALQVLRARLLDKMEQERHAQMSADRKKQVGSGDRSERIRTYNFPQGRMTDHRINLTLYRLDAIMDGALDEVVFPLVAKFQEQALQANA